MANRAIWSVRMKHEWLATPLKGKHLKKRKREPAAFDLPRLAAACNGFSGAEIEQAIVSALYAAFSAGSDLTTEILLQEVASTHPLSVVRAEEVSSLREWAASRTVPAS